MQVFLHRGLRYVIAIIIFMALSVISTTTSKVLGIIYISPHRPHVPSSLLYCFHDIQSILIFGRALVVPNGV